MRKIKLVRLFLESTNYIEVPSNCIKYINKVDNRVSDEIYEGCVLQDGNHFNKCMNFSIGIININELIYSLSNVIGSYIDAENVLMTNRTLTQVEIEFTDGYKDLFSLKYREENGQNIYERIYKRDGEIKINVKK